MPSERSVSRTQDPAPAFQPLPSQSGRDRCTETNYNASGATGIKRKGEIAVPALANAQTLEKVSEEQKGAPL